MKFFSRRLFKRVAIGLALAIGLLLVGIGILNGCANYRIEGRLAPLRAADEPTSLSELAPKPIQNEKNAAFYLEQIAPQLDAFANDYGEFYQTPLGKSWAELEEKNAAPTAEQLAAMRQILDQYPEILPALKQAATCDAFASLNDFSLPIDKYLAEIMKFGRSHNLAHFVMWKMTTLDAEQKPAEAIRLGSQLLRVSTMPGHDSSLIEYLVSVAVQISMIDSLSFAVRSGRIPPEAHAALDHLLAQTDNPARVVHAMQAERALSLSFFKANVTRSPLVGRLIFWREANWLCELLDYYSQIIPIADRPWYAVHDDPHWRKTTAAPNHQGPFVALLVPPIRGAFSASTRATVFIRCLRILNALCQYRETNGREAQSLADLNLPAEATIDPFSGKPLLMKKIATGWVIYSVNENGIDDGGDFKEQKDWGLGPPGYPR